MFKRPYHIRGRKDLVPLFVVDLWMRGTWIGIPVERILAFPGTEQH